MQKGKINVTTENIFPIIKKFLYSDHEIFLRELVSNAVDASQKIKTLASVGDFKGELGELKVEINLDTDKKTLTISDKGIGMTAEEIDKYINQIAFSSAEEFLKKYEDKGSIIGHFGLGFYSSFMVADKVEIVTKSYKEEAAPVKWSCDGTPNFSIEETEKEERGTDIILYLGEEGKEFNDKNKIDELLKKYCRFLPFPIVFGKEQEWKDDKYVDTDKDKIINDSNPLWTRMPVDLKEEDYQKFYKDLYPMSDDPLFNIHLNVDYPFNLTGILYFPKIKNNIEIQKNKIQLYCNQVFVTDSVEGIVPEFLTLLHGVIDSPDIPLNVSRSYLQSDSNVKKISGHITKKVADRLNEIFKSDRPEFEKKWDDLKLFITYGMISEEKFYERAEKFALLKNTEGKYFTFEEYQNLIKENQTDKNKQLIYLYTTDAVEQYTYIENAKAKGYDVLLLDGQLDAHYINHLEQKFKDSRFVRVDSDIIEKLIEKDEKLESKLSDEQKDLAKPVFEAHLPQDSTFWVTVEPMSENEPPIVITQSEFMRRMKDMSKMGGGGMMGMYGNMPDTMNMVVNANHPLVANLVDETEKTCGKEVKDLDEKATPLKEEKQKLEEAKNKKKEEEVTQEEKDQIENLEKQLTEISNKRTEILKNFGKENKISKQMIDLALLANGMLKGEELNKFIKRSVDLIK